MRKVSGRSKLKAPDEVRGMFLDNQPEASGIDAIFATHPSIEDRIAALVKFAGGRDEPIIVGTAVPSTTSTSVPIG